MNRLKNTKAFTLIEVIIVIAIIGILTTVAYPRYMKYVERAQITRIKSDLRSAKTEYFMRSYLDENSLSQSDKNNGFYNRLEAKAVVYSSESKDLNDLEFKEGLRIVDTRNMNGSKNFMFFVDDNGETYSSDLSNEIKPEVFENLMNEKIGPIDPKYKGLVQAFRFFDEKGNIVFYSKVVTLTDIGEATRYADRIANYQAYGYEYFDHDGKDKEKVLKEGDAKYSDLLEKGKITFAYVDYRPIKK